MLETPAGRGAQSLIALDFLLARSVNSPLSPVPIPPIPRGLGSHRHAVPAAQSRLAPATPEQAAKLGRETSVSRQPSRPRRQNDDVRLRTLHLPRAGRRRRNEAALADGYRRPARQKMAKSVHDMVASCILRRLTAWAEKLWKVARSGGFFEWQCAISRCTYAM